MTSLFVIHHGMDMEGGQPDPHEYWKMRVVLMHKDQLTQQRWVVGAWFYTPSQLRDINLKPRYEYVIHC
jgi:hypothetical protein